MSDNHEPNAPGGSLQLPDNTVGHCLVLNEGEGYRTQVAIAHGGEPMDALDVAIRAAVMTRVIRQGAREALRAMGCPDAAADCLFQAAETTIDGGQFDTKFNCQTVKNPNRKD